MLRRANFCLLLIPIALSGCTSSSPPIPPVEQIAKVQLTVTHLPANAGRKGGCQVALTAQRDLTVVVDLALKLPKEQ
jgi:hypothetical protein